MGMINLGVAKLSSHRERASSNPRGRVIWSFFLSQRWRFKSDRKERDHKVVCRWRRLELGEWGEHEGIGVIKDCALLKADNRCNSLYFVSLILFMDGSFLDNDFRKRFPYFIIPIAVVAVSLVLLFLVLSFYYYFIFFLLFFIFLSLLLSFLLLLYLSLLLLLLSLLLLSLLLLLLFIKFVLVF